MSGSADADSDFDAAAADVEAAARRALYEAETDSVKWVSSEECARAMMVDPELLRLQLTLEKLHKWHACLKETATKLLLFFVVLCFFPLTALITSTEYVQIMRPLHAGATCVLCYQKDVTKKKGYNFVLLG